jgi:YHS domain-containing protein
MEPIISYLSGFFLSTILPQSGMFKDPMCKMMVDEKTAKHVSEVSGKKVYSCSAACKSQFDTNPMKFGY